ncbi:flippase-like domain-containing protein [Persicimonas caeni]|uniref:Flippase-like domain-containing protein n=1 Tax=Persicimonas caeni TaxID=2292766 RepID=A0A4Y6Q0Q5_PERCE|nr:lysylphosphatidylglycerol synthase transmembrane domain-containing protein [Persicimonas caeni]QDG54178.1 flippase-like domain-containing protein [Persicimonas caeni]QED35399.1 flippase-like domain-containing protein [Persicimonas caeni]
MGKLEKRIVWGVILGAVVYAGIALFSDVSELLDHLATFPLAVMAAALGLSVLNYGFRFLKWHAYLGRLGFRIPAGSSLNIFLAGMVMSVTPGKVGEVLKSLLLKERHGLPVAKTAPVVLAERITDLLGLFVIAGIGITTFDYGRWAFGVSLGLVLALILVLNRPSLVGALLDLCEKLPLVGGLRPKLEDAYASTRRLLGWKLLSWTTLISVIGWSMEALAFYLILDALGAQHAGIELAAFVFSMTTILGAVSFLPGGLGVTEGSMIGVLMVMAVFAEQSSAAAATYLIRFATLWFGVVVGFVALIWFRAREPEPESLDS